MVDRVGGTDSLNQRNTIWWTDQRNGTGQDGSGMVEWRPSKDKKAKATTKD